jgi:hypothetical protein
MRKGPVITTGPFLMCLCQAGALTEGRLLAMTFLASERGLVRKPYPHDMCIVASATGIWRRAFSERPFPAGSEPAVIAAR